MANALYVLNRLTVLPNSQNRVTVNHFLPLQSSSEVQLPKPKILVRDLITKKWEDPWDLVTWGLRYACIFTDAGVQWVPVRCVRPALCSALDHNQQRLPDGPSADAVEQ